MISKMSCVEVAGPLDEFDAVVDTIQDAGILHIEEIPLAEYGEREQLHKIHLSEEKAQEHKNVHELVDMLSEAVEYIPAQVVRELRNSKATAAEYDRWAPEPLDTLSSAARVLHAKVRSFKRRERNLSDDLQVLSSYEEVVDALAPLVEGNVLPENYEFVGVILEEKAKLGRDRLQQELQNLTNGQYRYFETTLSKGRQAVLIGYHNTYTHEVRSFISRAGIGEMNFPRHLRNKPFEEAFAMLEEELDQLRQKKRQLDEQAQKFYEENGAQLIALEHICKDRLSRFEAIGKFARTEYTFIIKGWVLKKRLPEFRQMLNDVGGSSVVVRELRRSDIGSPPVLLDNPKPSKNFEPLLGLLPPPQYGSVDPTNFIAFFFPPMFGLMLGDIGYGAILLIISLILYGISKHRALMRKLSVVGGLCGLFTIGFGFFFGEMFGTFGHEIGLHAIWRERFPPGGEGIRESMIGYLLIAGAVGLVHITIGHILGIVNAFRRGHESEVYTNAGRMIGLYILLFGVGSLVGFLPSWLIWVAVVLAGVFLVLMTIEVRREPTHGFLMPLEVLSSMGNVFSYARIFAIGMASVVLAVLSNLFGGIISNIVAAAVVVLIFHTLTFVLGVVDPTIQGMRLHYVEFFSKFYQSGGKPYSPFRKLGNELSAAA
jgi:V/A-type H+-transporting ATPase subunit I